MDTEYCVTMTGYDVLEHFLRTVKSMAEPIEIRRKELLKQLASVLIIGLLFLCVISVTWAASYSNVTVFEAKSMIESDPSLVILDVRTQSEYDSGHIRNARLIPLTELEGRLNELNKTDKILVYCGSGTRSATASQILADNGFLHIYNMLWGITYWKLQGYTVYVKYSSIQQAINGASERQSLYVSSGTYLEHVVVNKTISLIGENRDSTVVDGSLGNYVILVTSDKVTVNGLVLQNGQNGIMLDNSNDSYISGNAFRSCFNGLLLSSSCNNTVLENVAENNNYGIRLSESSHYNIVKRNVLSNNDDGFHLNSDSNEIAENHVFNNLIGIRIWSSYNVITGNELSNNSIRVEGPYNDIIYHNNFYNVSLEYWNEVDDNSTWNNGCEGNFWSGYVGSDLDGDGVGDTSLPWLGVDNYPLMNPYWIPADANHDLKVDILDVVKITGCYATTPSDPDYNPHADIAEPFGRIDILDVVLCTGHYGEKYP